MSALPKADMRLRRDIGRLGPFPDVSRRSKSSYSITSSARLGRQRYIDAERLCTLEIDRKIELGWLHESANCQGSVMAHTSITKPPAQTGTGAGTQ
jgi:hypothetical protein